MKEKEDINTCATYTNVPLRVGISPAWSNLHSADGLTQPPCAFSDPLGLRLPSTVRTSALVLPSLHPSLPEKSAETVPPHFIPLTLGNQNVQSFVPAHSAQSIHTLTPDRGPLQPC